MLANLKALRTAQGLSQRALADFVKVSQQSINQYENRDTEPDIAVLTRIADYFGVSIDYLVGHDPAAGELIPTNLTDAELRLILNFRQLDDDQQRSMNLLVMQMTKDTSATPSRRSNSRFFRSLNAKALAFALLLCHYDADRCSSDSLSASMAMNSPFVGLSSFVATRQPNALLSVSMRPLLHATSMAWRMARSTLLAEVL